MDPLSELPQVLPLSLRSKTIKKIRKISGDENKDMNIILENKRISMEEHRKPKVKTILLNQILKEGNGPYKFGNILITRMSTDNILEREKFRKIVRTVM